MSMKVRLLFCHGCKVKPCPLLCHGYTAMLYHLLDYGRIFHRRKVSCPAQHHHWRYQELKLVEEGAPEEALDLGKQLGLWEVSEVFEAELLLDEGYVEGEKLGDVTEDGHGLLG